MQAGLNMSPGQCRDPKVSRDTQSGQVKQDRIGPEKQVTRTSLHRSERFIAFGELILTHLRIHSGGMCRACGMSFYGGLRVSSSFLRDCFHRSQDVMAFSLPDGIKHTKIKE